MRHGGKYLLMYDKSVTEASSDDEGEGAESEAVFKDQKRRETVLQAVIDEVKKANKK